MSAAGPGEAPPFWWDKADWRAAALSPLSAVYAAVAGRRLRTARREKVAAPVLCVGNLTVGGAGKTPAAIALAVSAAAHGLKPGFLSRGYGGGGRRPHLVDADRDAAKFVGDEPLLLARAAATAVTPDRAAGARLLLDRGCDFLIMDDGFQSARIHYDFALIVIDARRGVGNGHVIPGGPLRARLLDQLPFVDAVLRIGEGAGADTALRMAARAGRPIFHARVKPRPAPDLAGAKALAFAGIGDPGKFFDTVRELGGEIVQARAFPDHHFYSREDIAELRAAAQSKGLRLVTTAKDAARLAHDRAAADDFAAQLKIVHIDAVFEDAAAPRRIIDETIKAWRARRLKRS